MLAEFLPGVGLESSIIPVEGKTKIERKSTYVIKKWSKLIIKANFSLDFKFKYDILIINQWSILKLLKKSHYTFINHTELEFFLIDRKIPKSFAMRFKSGKSQPIN